MSTSKNSSNAAQVTATIAGKDLHLNINRQRQEAETGIGHEKAQAREKHFKKIQSDEFKNDCAMLVNELAAAFPEEDAAEYRLDHFFDGYLCSEAFEKNENKEETVSVYRNMHYALRELMIFFSRHQLGAWE